MNQAKGFEPVFLGKHLKVPLPQVNASSKRDLAPVEGSKSTVLHYPHHSVVLSRKRKFPLFTAVNIDGKAFRNINRESLFPSGDDKWEIDERARDFQWGVELYSTKGSDFDKGHLVKREDPQWGNDEEMAANAARSTFFYANCVPQVGDLNRKEWLSLENYILKKESAANKLKVSVFTGPVLADDDPFFINTVRGQEVQIPVLFWKLVYFSGDGKTLSRVAFLMGQRELLFKRRIVRPKPEGELETIIVKPKLFEDFDDAATYQVNVAVVEQLTGLSFSPANEPYRDTRPVKIILKHVEVEGLESFSSGNALDFELDGLVLQ